MDTSQYDAETRKQLKRFQRSAAYHEMKKRSAEAIAKLETKLRERDETITKLKKKLEEMGASVEETTAAA